MVNSIRKGRTDNPNVLLPGNYSKTTERIGKWRLFLEAALAHPGQWARTPFPILNISSAKQNASNIRNNICLSKPPRLPDGTFIIVPDMGDWEVKYTDEGHTYAVWVKWHPTADTLKNHYTTEQIKEAVGGKRKSARPRKSTRR